MNQAIDAVGLPAAEVAAWRSADPTGTVDLTADRERFGTFWRLTERLLARLPARPARGPAEARGRDTPCGARGAGSFPRAARGSGLYRRHRRTKPFCPHRRPGAAGR
jgi:hypothetical protein